MYIILVAETRDHFVYTYCIHVQVVLTVHEGTCRLAAMMPKCEANYVMILPLANTLSISQH